MSDSLYEEQLSAAKFRAERDQARQELDRMRPAFEWVEEHGGLDKIRQQRRDSIPRAAYERKRGKLLKHIAVCETALGKRKKRVEPLEVGQVVWTLDNPIFECGVIGFGNGMVHLKSGADHLLQREPSDLTHQRPEPPDSWERIDEDAGKNPFDYCNDVGHRLDTCVNAERVKSRDLVRRCRALAERERGE